MKFEAVIFDLGGTLLEYASVYETWPELESPGFAAAHAYLAQAGVRLPPLKSFQKKGFELLPGRWQEATAGIRNLTVGSLLLEVMAAMDIEIPSDFHIREAAAKYQAAVCAGVSPIQGSYETIRAVKSEGFKLGLVSNTMFDGEMHIADMRRFGLAAPFDAMVFSADVNKWKPNSEVFMHVLHKLQAAPANTVFIGDDPEVDVVGGLRAGMYTIHYPSSQRFSSIDGVKPDAVIYSLDELPKLLADLNSGHGASHI
ncbi:MAG: HAD family hydrolase [Candidatus Promineifilaceae bacterium]